MSRLKAVSDWDSRMRRGKEFQIRGFRSGKQEIQMLCLGINSWWEEDERKDLVGWWCCKRAV